MPSQWLYGAFPLPDSDSETDTNGYSTHWHRSLYIHRSVETVPHITIEAIGICLGLCIGIGLGQWKHTIKLGANAFPEVQNKDINDPRIKKKLIMKQFIHLHQNFVPFLF